MLKQLKTLAILSLAFSLTACGSSETADTETPAEEQQTQEAAPQETAEPVKEEEPAEQVPEFEPYTVIDNDECTVTVKNITVGNDVEVKLTFENKSDSAEYAFEVNELSINGLAMDPYSFGFASKTLPAGKKANASMQGIKRVLKEDGIEQDPTDIEIHMTVRDYNDYFAEAAADETFHIYPYGEDKAVSYVYEPADNHHVLLDNDDLKIVQTELEKKTDSPYGPGYIGRFYIENKTDVTLEIYSQNAYLNGYEVSAYLDGTLGPGKCTFKTLYISEQTLKDNDIETVEEAELEVGAYDYDSYENVFSDTITLVP